MKPFSLDPRFSAIAVTGGPCAGKTTFMAVARQYLEDRGMRVAVLSEVATEFINAGFSPISGWKDNLSFQKYLLEYMRGREDLYRRMLSDQATNKPLVLLCDRGALDSIAYVGRDAFLTVIEELVFNLHDLREQYRAVVHMITAADGAEEHYTLENNKARSEDIAKALELDARTLNAWVGHQHLFVIDNSTGFKKKIQRALTSLARVLDMPTPKEKERKFIFKNWDPSLLPEETVSVEITQDYLFYGPNKEERRVRMRTLDGSSSYYYTEKSKTGEVGVRHEKEEQITRRRYEELLRIDRDPAAMTVLKTRHNVPFAGYILQIDEFHQPLGDDALTTVEVEVADMSDPVTFPPEWDLEEVTGVSKYSNRKIAEGSLLAA